MVGLAHLLARERGSEDEDDRDDHDHAAGDEDDGEAEAAVVVGSDQVPLRPLPVRRRRPRALAGPTAPEQSLARWTHELSHGERQRLAFARLFCWRPAVAGTPRCVCVLMVDRH
jgi:ABC-type uncharacterized transport system fused permease/ATPase subunit